MKIELELNDTHVFNRAGVEMTVNMDLLRPEILAELVYHGLTQKIGDAAAGSKGNADEATGMMAKVRDALYEGNWGVKREGGARITDPVARAAMAIAGLELDAMKEKKSILAAVVTKYDVTPAKARSMVLAKIAAKPDVQERAKEQVREMAAAPDLDLGELGL